MQENIWSKLGATSTTFRPEIHRNTLPASFEMAYRVSTGQGAKSVKPGSVTLKQPAEDALGGIGLFSTAADYMKLLTALLKDGSPLFSRGSLDIFLKPHLSDASREAMPKPLGVQMRRVLGVKNLEDTRQADHCLGGTVTLRDIPGRRKAGTISWSGLPNMHWVRAL